MNKALPNLELQRLTRRYEAEANVGKNDRTVFQLLPELLDEGVGIDALRRLDRFAVLVDDRVLIL